MSSKAQALAAIQVGDLLLGIRDDARADLLLVYRTEDDAFWARNVPNQATYKFGRDGTGRRLEDGRSCTIVSIKALPPNMHEAAIGLDRKWAAKPEYPDTILSKAQIQLLLTYEEFFKADVLPGTEVIVKQAERVAAIRSILDLELDRSDARDNPPTLDEYDEYLPALVSLLQQSSSKDDVVRFLAAAALAKNRPQNVHRQIEGAAASLVGLARTWT